MKKSTSHFGFKALLATQFLGAFNDNAFKLIISLLAIKSFFQHGSGTFYLSISGAIFILPFLLFSTYAGFLADRYSKKTIIVSAKIAELVVMFLGYITLLNGDIWPLFFVLFAMGLQSTFFGPSKYGILPEILHSDDLSEGNGLIQLWTYAAIILGQAAGGYLSHITSPFLYKSSYFFMAISFIGILTSLFVSNVPASGAKRGFNPNMFSEVFKGIKEVKKNEAIFLSIMGLTYFGFLSGLFQLNILLYAQDVMQLNDFLSSTLLVYLAVGLGVGSFLAGRCSDQKIELGIVPVGAIGLSFFTIFLGYVYAHYSAVAICLFVLGLSAGFYIIPLHALIQSESPHDQRGQVLAINNFLSFSGIFLGFSSLFFLSDVLHLNAAQIFVFVGIITVLGTGYICKLLPYALLRFVVWTLTHTIYKIRIVNREKIPQHGGGLIVANHVSYIDALVLVVCVQRPLRFLVHREIYNLKPLNPILKLARAIPIAGTDNPKEIIRSLETAREAVLNGELVCIFPEGRLTRTGNIHKFNKGFERIIKETSCPVIPVYLDRIWGSIFSYEGGKYFYKVPKIIPYPITVLVGDAMPSPVTAFAARQKVRELGSDAFQYRFADKMTLPEAFWREAKNHPFRFCMADTSGKSMNYGMTLMSSVSLANQLRPELKDEKNIGILIPPSMGGVLVNVAVSLINKIPINLNYTTSAESLAAVQSQCEMKTVITSRRFLEKIKMEVPGRCLYLEDIVQTITARDKARAFFQSFVLPKRLTLGKVSCSIDDLVTIMFTSGSTGNPKGVMLSHANVTSNLEGLYQIFKVNPEDKIMGILPFFHSFGFTATIWFPLISGMGAVYHANPLDAKMIGKLAQNTQATLLMATPTFLNTYTKRCSREEFKSLRLVVVGAEKLKSEIASAFEEKFGITPMEGYGCTELSPIVSLNLPDIKDERLRISEVLHKTGKIGLPLPGITVKVVDQDTRESLGANENGLLYVKGPNVMKGYLNNPEKTQEVIHDGWYFTGDIANIDEDGFIAITDRLSRFSKIGGEMVPHIKIEEKMHSILKVTEQVCVVSSVGDAKKGEKLVVLCLKDVDVPSLVDALKQSDLPNLWVPSAENFHKVDAIPILGTGKLDLGTIKKIAKEIFEVEDEVA